MGSSSSIPKRASGRVVWPRGEIVIRLAKRNREHLSTPQLFEPLFSLHSKPFDLISILCILLFLITVSKQTRTFSHIQKGVVKCAN